MRRQIRRDSPRRIGRRTTMSAPAALGRTGLLSGAGCGLRGTARAINWNGLLAPAYCTDGSVCLDLNLVVTGTAVPYDSLVILHRFGPQSFLYTLDAPSRFSVFVDPAIPVLTPEAMGADWVVLCQDEVYVRDRIAPEDLTSVAVHHADIDSVVGDLIADFQRLGIPLYDYDGIVLWEPA